jgi:thioredoxin
MVVLSETILEQSVLLKEQQRRNLIHQLLLTGLAVILSVLPARVRRSTQLARVVHLVEAPVAPAAFEDAADAATAPKEGDVDINELRAMKTSEITAKLSEMEIAYKDIYDKEDLVQRLHEAMVSLPPSTIAPEADNGFCKSGRCKPGTVTHLSEAELEEELNDPSTPMLLDVYATWCGPCRMMAPKLESVARTLQDKVRVMKVDSDEAPSIVGKLRVKSLPTFIVFNPQGVEVQRHLGMTTEENLISMVDEASSDPPYIWTGGGGVPSTKWS